MIERVAQPADPRHSPMVRLAEITRCPHDDDEARADRKLLRRLEIREAVRR